ncbi:cobalt-zinc-cadmium resistance protein CzcA [Mariprofundus micogutta]|uniref:Cobalt-zinc-cadmium resistance protein CzcA n=1 Tax=Mariprofundus micogutta TaxID=1921010 RepID=A0A1L8CP96_9PROT|nr:CusA/CzcA family heavy metal efflux RND transporter [Mariprofundus micogutta]GAV20649.1 cobalt-zinc-cadmium resistance protein CzcA [Mariprofundus micogutta]
MFSKLIDAAVNNRLLILLLLLGSMAYALFVVPKLNLDAFPDVTNVQVQINTEAQGLASEEVEQLITYPIEAVMYALPDVEEVRSISKTGLSVITVVFKEGTDIYFARQLVFQKLQDASQTVPTWAGTPKIGPNTSGLGQVFQYIIKSAPEAGFDALTLRALNDWVVKLMLMPVEGVTDILSYGGETRQYQVQVNPQQLLSYNLHVDDVAKAIEANNRNAGGWYLPQGDEQLVIRGVGWVPGGEEGLKAIAAIPVKTVDGTSIRVSDVATVAFGGEIRQGAVTMTERTEDGKITSLGEVVVGITLKRFGANTKNTIDDVKSRLEIVQKALPKGVTIQPFYDQSDLINKAVWTVEKALLEAFILIIIVLFLFLMNMRAATLVLLSVPISILAALGVMQHYGISANLMSLGGLAIAIGMMVDGSVVMVENIFKHLEKAREGDHGIALLITEAAKEVARPVLFAVLIILLVFTPLFSLEGVEGKMFTPMALSICFAMFASLLVALFVMPVLATYAFTKGVVHKDSPVLAPIARAYHGLLKSALKARKAVVGGAAAAFVLTIATVPFLGTEFVPELEEGTLAIRITLAPSSSLEYAKGVGEKLERVLIEKFPEITYVSARTGRAEIGGDPEPVSNVELFIGLKPVSEWTSASDRKELQNLMREEMEVVPGILISFTQPIAMRVDELLSGVKAALAIKLFGPDLKVLAEMGKKIETVAKSTEGTRDVEMEQIEGEAQLVVRPDRSKLDRYGIPVDDVMSLVADAIGGASAGQVIQGNERYDIYVRLAKDYRHNTESIGSLILQSPGGAWVRLEDVATIGVEQGPPMIKRDDVQRRVVIQSNVEGRDMGSLVAELDQRIQNEVDLPPGYTVVFGGQFENQQRAQAKLMVVVPLSLLMIFLLLYFAFHSVGQAALIMLNVPMALIGGILALLISGQYLSVPSSIGFIALFGVAVLNGVVLVDAINRHLDEHELGDAIRHGAESRLRPVLMTAMIAALGLIPLLLATGIGSEIQRPLATVVVGGLVSSTLLTLFVLPCLYERFSKSHIKEGK